jgi:hypothetical protein
MSAKAHGTCAQPVQSQLRFGCDRDTADRICKSLHTAPLHHHDTLLRVHLHITASH